MIGSKPLRVLHLPSPTGGMPQALARGERDLGLESRVLVAYQDWMQRPADYLVGAEKERSKLKRAAKLLKAFAQVRGQHDVFHFNFGTTLLDFPNFGARMLDLGLYPKKSKLFVTYNGCDARQKFPTMARTKIAACHDPTCYAGQCNSGELDRHRREGIEKMARHVDHLWAVNPDLLYFLPAEKSSFLPYSIEHQGVAQGTPVAEGKRIKVVHAPTNRAAKGSDHILNALERIQATPLGKNLEVVLVEKKPHHEALELYRSADLVIDQILIGWYGGFAVEVMYMGKPVIARIAKEDLHFVPSEMAQQLQQTVIHAEPSTIESAIRNCLENPQFLRERAQASREYAHRWHDPRYVASLTKARYEAS